MHCIDCVLGKRDKWAGTTSSMRTAAEHKTDVATIVSQFFMLGIDVAKSKSPSPLNIAPVL